MDDLMEVTVWLLAGGGFGWMAATVRERRDRNRGVLYILMVVGRGEPLTYRTLMVAFDPRRRRQRDAALRDHEGADSQAG